MGFEQFAIGAKVTDTGMTRTAGDSRVRGGSCRTRSASGGPGHRIRSSPQIRHPIERDTMKHLVRTPITRGLSVAAVLGLLAVAGCGSVPSPGPDTSGQGGTTKTGTTTGGGGSNTPSSTPEAPEPVSFSTSVADGAKNVKVSSIVSVKAANGTLDSVRVSTTQKSESGSTSKVTVDGALNADKTTWTASEALDPGSTYTIRMSGANSEGTQQSSTATFKTQSLTLDEQTFPTVFPGKGTTVGVGMPVILTFDVPVKDRANVEKHLAVTTSPKQTGTWHWVSSTEVHYRPKTYWQPGTKVSVDGNLNGVSAGNGVYGQKSVATSFTIGRSQITKIDLKRDVAKVYRNGKAVRTIYVSAGKPGWETRSGIKLIMSKETNKRMTNQMIGAAEEYDLNVAYALRITNSGEFLHSAPWNAGYFGRVNSSHGCTGMSTADARWLYETSLIGDPTVTTGTNRGMEKVNGWSDWNISWNDYKAGSAL